MNGSTLHRNRKRSTLLCFGGSTGFMGAWLVTRIWGGKGRGRQQKDELCSSYEQALGRMEELAFYRQRERNYTQIS